MGYKTAKDSCPYKVDDSQGHLSYGLRWKLYEGIQATEQRENLDPA